MKVLYVGCYRDGTGWGQAATDYILAMDSVGIDVVPRPVKLNKNNIPIPNRITELERKDSSGAEVCIQHILPHLMEYTPKFKKNIGLYATETSNFIDSGWSRKINMMDEAWVINNQMVKSSQASGVEIPIKVVPHASNFSKFGQSYGKTNFPSASDNFIFYTIADLNKRKNLEAFITAFHAEFDPSEPVSILIKSSKYGLSEEEAALKVRDICNEIKIGLKRFPSIDDYKEDLIVTSFISEEDIYKIHTSCDCFVMPSYGEAWCIPAFDAMGFGKTPICTNVGGMSDFIGHGGFLIEGIDEPVTGMLETFNNLFTGNEFWSSISIKELMRCMRHVYEQRDALNKMREEGLKQAQKYSHKNIGNLIKDLLNANS
jgi:glycosyltransferase involved in cell wall biosynthesis